MYPYCRRSPRDKPSLLSPRLHETKECENMKNPEAVSTGSSSTSGFLYATVGDLFVLIRREDESEELEENDYCTSSGALIYKQSIR